MIYLCVENQELSKRLIQFMHEHNISVNNYTDCYSMLGNIGSKHPDVILVDHSLVNNTHKKAFKIYSQSNTHASPVIFLADNYDAQQHIESVSYGGRGFFTRPIDLDDLLDTVNELILEQIPQSPHVLLVDDDAATATFYTAVLNKAGIKVTYIDKPFDVIPELININPDLILLDLYMPDCEGQNLASAIRHKKNYKDLPILFLSGEENIEKQLNVLQHGADEFLTKSIKSEQLISIVINRIQQHHQLKNMFYYDQLTGLLNGRALNDALETELSRCERLDSPMSLARINIDNISRINTQYGFSVGDKVIRFLGKLLNQRLRTVDVLSRYNGDEFIVLLPNTPGHNARQVVKDISQAFSKYQHTHLNDTFSATLSSGVTSYPELQDATSLLKASKTIMFKSKLNQDK